MRIRSSQERYLRPYLSGLGRRQFLKTQAAMAILLPFGLQKPGLSASTADHLPAIDISQDDLFTKPEATALKSLQRHLFPNDGNGPSADDIHAYQYLAWALTDPDNQEDGDHAFILEGLKQLQAVSNAAFKSAFNTLSGANKELVLNQLVRKPEGENFLALLLYYLTEALLLDPIYGGNRRQQGWLWLEHQPGFPRPTATTRFERFVYQNKRNS